MGRQVASGHSLPVECGRQAQRSEGNVTAGGERGETALHESSTQRARREVSAQCAWCVATICARKSGVRSESQRSSAAERA